MLLVNLIIFLGVGCSILTSLIVLTQNKGYSKQPTLLLATYLTLSAVSFGFYLLIAHGHLVHFPYLYRVARPIGFLVAPIAYLYVRTTLYTQRPLIKRDLAHLVIPILIAVNYIPLYTMPLEEKRQLVHEILNNIDLVFKRKEGFVEEKIIHIVNLTHVLFYYCWIWISLRLFYKKNMFTSSYFLVIKKWLYSFITLISLNIVALIISVGFLAAYEPSSDFRRGVVAFLSEILVGLVYFALSTYILIQPKVLLAISTSRNSVDQYAKEVSGSFKRVNDYVTENKRFLNPELNNEELAVELNTNSKILGQLIKANDFKNFKDYLNSLRINHATKLLEKGLDPSHSIDAIYLESGFNSRATFYRAFKKSYDCSPIEYMEQIKNKTP